MSSNVHKSEQGWKAFQTRTEKGKRKRPVRAFGTVTRSRYRKLKGG